jgi:hypothetical protein
VHLEALSIFSISAATALNIYVAVSKKRSSADHPTCREALEALKEETTASVYLNVTASVFAGGAAVLLLMDAFLGASH